MAPDGGRDVLLPQPRRVKGLVVGETSLFESRRDHRHMGGVQDYVSHYYTINNTLGSIDCRAAPVLAAPPGIIWVEKVIRICGWWTVVALEFTCMTVISLWAPGHSASSGPPSFLRTGLAGLSLGHHRALRRHGVLLMINSGTLALVGRTVYGARRRVPSS